MKEEFESSEVLLVLDDEYFFGSYMELQSLIAEGWSAVERHTDISTDSSWVTLKRPVIMAS